MGTMSSMKKLTTNKELGKDEKLLRELRQGASSAFEAIFRRAFPGCLRYAKANGGTTTEARDVFNECLTILYENARLDSFVLSTSIQNYLFGIYRRRWLMSKKTNLPKGMRKVELKDQDGLAFAENPFEEEGYSAEVKAQLPGALEQISEKCRDLLLDNIAAGIKLTELAKDLGTTSEVLRVQKHRCLKKLKKIMQKNKSHD